MRALHGPAARTGRRALSGEDSAPQEPRPAAGSGAGVGPRLHRIVLALALGTSGGWAAHLLQLPLPWMIGAMLVTTVAAAARAPVAVPNSLRNLMVTILGVMLGSGFSPAILERLGEWAVSLSALAAYIAVSGAAGLFYFRRICGYDPVTAYFAATPGGLSEMVVVGSAMGGDTRLIALTHAARVLLVVLALPFAFQLLAGYEPAARPPAGLPLLAVSARDLAILGACGLVGFLGARALRIPAAAVVGPMLLSAGVHLAGWTAAKPPIELVAAAQVVMGTAVGCRFAGVSTGLLARSVLASAGGTLILMTMTLAFAFGLGRILDLPAPALVLAFAPGGLAEMSLIALAINVETAFVATHHIVRIFLIVVCAPLIFRLLRGKRR